MGDQTSTEAYRDLRRGTTEQTVFFFLEHVLKARLDLHLETGGHDGDEEVNVYLSHVMVSYIASADGSKGKPYLSPYDADVRGYLDSRNDLRTEYTVYKDNADFGLVSTAVFLGYEHPGSYHGRVIGTSDESGRIAFYYRMAGSTLAHLRGERVGLVRTLYSMSDNIGEVVRIVRKASGDYFDFMEHLSGGSLFHLEQDVDRASREKAYREKLDVFLAAYSEHRGTPTAETRARLEALAAELRMLNPRFRFGDEAPAGKGGEKRSGA